VHKPHHHDKVADLGGEQNDSITLFIAVTFEYFVWIFQYK